MVFSQQVVRLLDELHPVIPLFNDKSTRKLLNSVVFLQNSPRNLAINRVR